MLRFVSAGPSTKLGHRPAFADRSELVADAFGLAADAHAGQVRKDDGSAYISHPVKVAARLHDAGFDDEVVAAALLHDVVEDTDMEPDDIAARFGDRVAELVEALSDDEGISDYEERKRAHAEQVAEAGANAVAIYVADKLSNLADLRRIYAEEGEAIASRFKAPLDVRVALWREDLEMAKGSGAELPYLAEFEQSLDQFGRDRDARRAEG
jgi:(p)ppGpp synthase/HD superfamily hydrolase